MSLARPVSSARRSTLILESIGRLARRPLLWQGAVVLLAIALTSYYTLRADRDLWYDEAMLVQAIRADGWLAPWQPLTHFEQASPWGVYLVQKASLELVGFQPDLLRIPGLVVYAVGAIATWLAARIWLGGVAALLAGVWAAASLDVVQNAGDFKHYVFEFCAAGVLLWLTARAARTPTRRNDVVLLVAALAAIPFSNTVVLVVPGLAVVLLAGRGRAAVTRTLVGVAAFLVAYGIWYLVAIRPSSVYQIAYPTYRETSTVDLYSTIVQAVAQPSASYFLPLAAVATAGVAIALVWRRRLALLSVPAIGAAVLGWIGVWTGFVPFSADRHVLFMVPLIALAAGVAMRAVLDVARRAAPIGPGAAPAATAVIGLVIAFGATATIAPSAGVLRQQAGQALTDYRTTCATFYVDWWTQPSTVLYAESDGLSDRVLGAVDTRSGAGQDAWAYRVMDAPKAYQTALVRYVRGHPDTCVLTGGRDDETGLVLQPLAAAGLPCTQIAVVPGIQINRCRKEDS